jgi:hypothetical protein
MLRTGQLTPPQGAVWDPENWYSPKMDMAESFARGMFNPNRLVGNPGLQQRDARYKDALGNVGVRRDAFSGSVGLNTPWQAPPGVNQMAAKLNREAGAKGVRLAMEVFLGR